MTVTPSERDLAYGFLAEVFREVNERIAMRPAWARAALDKRLAAVAQRARDARREEQR